MKKSMIILTLIFLISLSAVSASTYSVTFNQVGDKLAVNEDVSGVYSSYVDTTSLQKTSSGNVFLKKISFPDNFDNVIVRLNLEKGFIIDNQDAYPTNYLLETDGQAISLVWNFENITKDSSLAFFVSIKNTNSNSVWIIILGIIIVLVLILVAWFFYSRKGKVKSSSSKFEQHLLESEKKVISELKKADRNELWQKQLQLATGFSKAKLSRVIRNLESRDLIKKIPMGNTNKICLK